MFIHHLFHILEIKDIVFEKEPIYNCVSNGFRYVSTVKAM